MIEDNGDPLNRASAAYQGPPEPTPGPWEVWKGHARVFARVTHNFTSNIDGVEIADCEKSVDGEDFALLKEEAVANARLIAAAPVLLAESKKLLALMDELPAVPGGQQDRVFAESEFDGLRAAIAAAGA